MERYIAVDNVCAWPNVTRLPDGALASTVYNRPVHGRWHGDVEIWASTDGGRVWSRRGVAAVGEPPGNRMNVAVGRAADGALVVIASGWTPVLEPGVEDPNFAFTKRTVVPNLVCRSSDGGATWERHETLEEPDGDWQWFIPFGDIVEGPAGLAVPLYSQPAEGGGNTAWMLRSTDDGRTWGDSTIIGAHDYNETDLLHLGHGRWLAACRTLADRLVELLVSDDDGRSWDSRGPLTLPGQHPPHLLRLADGRVLLTYGIRNRGLYGLGARLSEDEGATWGPPIVLARFEGATDGGYPSSAQREDGLVVTAYYVNRVENHDRYHMGVLIWPVDDN